MKKIIYTRLDGGVSIVNPVSKEIVGRVEPKVLAMTEDEYIVWIRDKDVPSDATDVAIIDEGALPVDRSTRDKWVIRSGKVEVDPTVKTKGEKRKEKVASARAEIDKLGLSKNAVDLILKSE